jgi:hypothetical protein
MGCVIKTTKTAKTTSSAAAYKLCNATISPKGKQHMAYQSPEQIASAVLTPLGFYLVNRTLMPYSFTDKDGETFNAMADFYHPVLDLYVEIKCSHLNGKTSRANAERAYNHVEPEKRFGMRKEYYQIRNQWNHAAPKQAIVQSVITPQQFVIAFTKTPDDETVKRIEKQGIQAHSLKRFASMIQLQLAVMGSIASYDGNDAGPQ